jgi:hypothetical protein
MLSLLSGLYVEPAIDPRREYAIERIAACRGITIGEARKQLDFDDFVAIELAERRLAVEPYVAIELPYTLH